MGTTIASINNQKFLIGLDRNRKVFPQSLMGFDLHQAQMDQCLRTRHSSDFDLSLHKEHQGGALLLGYTKRESTARYLGIEVADAPGGVQSQQGQRWLKQHGHDEGKYSA
jgi:hypothetical protein